MGYGIDDEIYSDYGDLDVSGKILIVFSGEPTKRNGKSIITGTRRLSRWTTNWRLKRTIAKEKNAAALIFISKESEYF